MNQKEQGAEKRGQYWAMIDRGKEDHVEERENWPPEEEPRAEKPRIPKPAETQVQ